MAGEAEQTAGAPRTVERRGFLGSAATLAAGAAGAGALLAAPRPARALARQEGAAGSGPAVSWNLASSFPPGLDILHGCVERLAERVAGLTGGAFRIRVYPAGEIVPPLEVLDAVQQGTVQAGFSPGYFYIGKSAALAFDTAVPFGFTPSQQAAWLYHGGGLELLREVYADFGIVNFPAGNTGTQFGGWFRRPVERLADLSGLRMRIPGMGGEIMARLGVSVQVLGGSDIYPALERGAIDATEWVGPYDDEKLGFHQIARYYYYPGWWEPGPNVSLLVGRRAWDALPSHYREAVATASREGYMDMLARYDAANPVALERLVREHGVIVRPFGDDLMEAAWQGSAAYLEEQSARDATFRRVHQAFSAFREKAFPYARGNELSYSSFAFPRSGRAAGS